MIGLETPIRVIGITRIISRIIVVVPLKNRDSAGNGADNSKMENMLAKVLQRVESTDSGDKEMNCDVSNMSQLVDSHSTSIKHVEHHMGKLCTVLNQRKNGKLPSDTVHNRYKDGQYMVIKTTSGKTLPARVLASI